MRLFFSLLLIAALSLLSACASEQPVREPFQTRIFKGSYDQVWIATLKALQDYPLKISNKDVGKIFSETINGPYNDLLFEYPEGIELPERFRYSLKFNFAKLTEDQDQKLVRVRVIKDLEKYKDFYTGWLRVPADGLEEKVLLYRIEQLLRIGQSLEKEGL